MFYIFCLSPTLFGLGAFAMAQANRRVEPRTRRARWVKFWSYSVVVHLVALAILAGPQIFAGFVIAILIIGGIELIAVDTGSKGKNRRKSFRVLTYLWFCAVGVGLFQFALDIPTNHAVFVYLLVAIMDGFSQLTGQLFGKHRIAPKISPNKTVEGTLGGVLASILLGASLYWLVDSRPLLATMSALCIAIAAFVGDLVASWVKRFNGVKDFGDLLPGQGGVLDRFDSLLMASTVYWILYNVSST